MFELMVVIAMLVLIGMVAGIIIGMLSVHKLESIRMQGIYEYLKILCSKDKDTEDNHNGKI